MEAMYSPTNTPIWLWTDFGQKKYDLYLNRGNNTYGIKFISVLRTFEPPNFDYMKKFQEEVDKLDSSENTSAMFSILSSLENIEFGANSVKARFLMPGLLNQTWTLNLDPQNQDFNGKIGLKIKCLIKRVEKDIHNSGVDSNTKQA